MLIHFLKTEWSDVIILQDKAHIALIDTGFEENYNQLKKYLTSYFTAPKIDFILNTHFHRDHYGCIGKLVQDFDVGAVYLKEYSGLDCTTAWGTPADDEYRAAEMKKFNDLKTLISEKSRYIPVEELKSIKFCDYEIELFNSGNTIRKIYDDPSVPETYHKICFSENTNSLAALLKIDGKNIFFGGDMMDGPSPHPLADKMLFQIAKKIDEKIDLYKVPHHGTVHTGLPETLEIFSPKIAVITNGIEYVTNESDTLNNLKTASPDIEIIFTKNSGKIFDIPHDLKKINLKFSTRLLIFLGLFFGGISTSLIYSCIKYGIKDFFSYLLGFIFFPLTSLIGFVAPDGIGFSIFMLIYWALLIGAAIGWLKKGHPFWAVLFAVLFLPPTFYAPIWFYQAMGI